MNPFRSLTKFLLVAVLALATTPAFAGLFVSVNLAPPALPYYAQPACPGIGYIWTPGYWAYGPDGYYWMPGEWVVPPAFGLLWTPCWWGWSGGAYIYHGGYWGPHVGFYGGINYGYGYNGNGYGGGYWRDGHFFYNRAVNNLAGGRFANTYSDRSFVSGANRGVSFNGGANGVHATATATQLRAANEHHVAATSAQTAEVRTASTNRSNFATANGGHPAVLTAERTAAPRNAAETAAVSHAATHDSAFTGASNTSAVREAKTTEHANTVGATHATSQTRMSSPGSFHAASHPQTHMASFHAASVGHAAGGGGGHSGGGGHAAGPSGRR
jgi:hypothetical protein